MATEIIEIIGPPGIGKTTLYNALCKRWHPRYNWTCQDVLLAHTPSFSDLNHWIEYQVRKALKRKLSKSISPVYGVRFAENHPEFSRFCWQQLSGESGDNNNNISMLFRSAYLLFSDFCRYQAIMEEESNIPCVLNEGLLQKSFLVEKDLASMEALIASYLALVPLPKAVIYINTDNKDLILERLVRREKVIATHVGKSRDELLKDIVKWQYQTELIISWMRSHKVQVYFIDGAKTIDENAMVITGNLDKLQLSNEPAEFLKINAAHL